MSKDRVMRQVEIKTAVDPYQRDDDPWEAFRQIEVITLELTQQYRHSLGKYSRFFIELEQGRFFATRCPRCERVYAPPRPLCPRCLTVAEWHELDGKGILETYSVMHFTSGANDDVNQLTLPVTLAYVLLDGASTLFPHVLKADPASIQMGMRVRVEYADQPVSHPIHLMYFVPMEA